MYGLCAALRAVWERYEPTVDWRSRAANSDSLVSGSETGVAERPLTTVALCPDMSGNVDGSEASVKRLLSPEVYASGVPYWLLDAVA